MKTLGEIIGDKNTDKPWSIYSGHKSKRPLVLCKSNFIGPGGLNCPCCNSLYKSFKRISNRAIRRAAKNEIEDQLD